MDFESRLKCPYLQGDPEGIKCCVKNELVLDMEETDMKLCLGRRYEACPIYFRALIMSSAETSLNAA